MFEAVQALLDEHAELERELSDPAIHSDPARARTVGRRYAALGRVVAAYQDWKSTTDDLEAARELAAEDPAFADEAAALSEHLAEAERTLRLQLVPRDEHADADVLVEVKAGEGGAESALFAGDLLRMYLRYAERLGWRTEILDSAESDLGGVKSVTLAVKGSGSDPDNTPFLKLRYEGGVHRVQRVPVTESQGRIHTSAAGVLVIPEVEDVDVEINDKDLRIDVFRSSGPGGQSVNTTDSAVRVTHIPTGIVVSCQNEKSQLQNKESAMRILRARMLARAEEEAASAAQMQRASQIRTVDRSERIRTYNYPQSRVTDHRIGFTTHNLSGVLDGELDALVAALTEADQAALLAGIEAGA
ncbi:MAG TPA: peptide chain release factor 1 [Actinopolymorphaceae bacterium]